MIVAIADDITGAAELAGIGLRYDLKVFLSNELVADHEPDLLVVYTNTRSLMKDKAVAEMEMLTTKAKQLNPSLFYKKTDSVLRGHVLAEMQAHMKAMNMKKGLLVPVNPSIGRVIRDEQYFVNDRPIHETSFSIDPEFPIKSSRVMDMLGHEQIDMKMIKRGDTRIPDGIAVGEAQTPQDLESWAGFHDGKTLLAGGGSFFNALLASQFPLKRESKREVSLATPLCLVSGTTFAKNVERIRKYPSKVSYMPGDIFSTKNLDKINYDDWVNAALKVLKKQRKLILAINNSWKKKADPDQLRAKIAEAVSLISQRANIKELLIEGGATAYTIINKLGWRRFIPTEELDQGIVRMAVVGVDDHHLTIKPGSYDWPPQWNFN